MIFKHREHRDLNLRLLPFQSANTLDARHSGQMDDRDGTFFPLDEVLRPTGIKLTKTPPQSPMCNAYAERFVRETRETLDQLILLGKAHLRRLLQKLEYHHNQQRPHQGLDNLIPLDFEYPGEPASPETVRCDANLGGLLNHHHAETVAA
jgi:hypothetical protein